MSGITHDDIAAMTAAERLLLIGDLWDSLEDSDLPLTPVEAAELTRRRDALQADPSQAVAWDELKVELEKRCP